MGAPMTHGYAPIMPVALITGASRGLGAAIARKLAPTHQLFLGARSVAALERIQTELPNSRALAVELTDHAAVANAVAGIDRLDVLVHNAGLGHRGTLADTDAQQWRDLMEVNVIAAAELTRLLLPALRAARGHVVLINSGSGLRANAGWGPYAASKFALRALAESLRLEEPGLRVTSIYPGRIDTDMQRGIVEAEQRPYNPDEFMTPSTVADLVRAAIQTPADAHPTQIELKPNPR